MGSLHLHGSSEEVTINLSFGDLSDERVFSQIPSGRYSAFLRPTLGHGSIGLQPEGAWFEIEEGEEVIDLSSAGFSVLRVELVDSDGVASTGRLTFNLYKIAYGPGGAARRVPGDRTLLSLSRLRGRNVHALVPPGLYSLEPGVPVISLDPMVDSDGGGEPVGGVPFEGEAGELTSILLMEL